MANGKITEKELADKKIYEIGPKFADSLKPAIEAMEALKQSALSYAKISKEFKLSKDYKEFLEIKAREEKLRISSANAIKAETNTLIVLEREKQALITTEKKQLDLDNKKIIIQKKKTTLTAEERLELQKINRDKKEAAKLSSALSTEYEKQSVRLIQLRRAYKDVALSEGETSRKAQQLRSEIDKLDTSLKRVDSNVGQFQRNVGNYGSAMKSAGGAVRSLFSAMGLVGGAFLFVQVMRDAVKVVRDYEKQNATLTGVLQATKDQTKELREESQRLGATTVKTAGEVVGLQISFARLGFSQQEIIDLTEATIQGSIALNSELSETAVLVGAMVNTFDDFSSIDAPEILDILSLATAKSALNFEKLQKGLPIVSGAANAAGIPFTKLVALMGKLADSGIDVSTSSTSLRNIFIIAAKEGLNYSQIIQKIKDSQDKLTVANDEFGRRAAVSATVLAQNIDATEELDEALQNAAGTAESMANKELDTLDGALKLLKSAWQGVILETDEASSVGTKLKNSIKFVADNLQGLIKILLYATGLWLLYKTAIIGVNIATTIGTKLNTLYRLSLIAMNGGIRKVILSLKAMKIATASTGIGLLLVALGSAYAIWQSFKDGATEATDELKKFNDESERMSTVQKTITDNLKGFKKGQDRFNVAYINYHRLLDDANKKLKEQGLNNQKINTALQLIQKSKETDIKLLDRQINAVATYTDSQKKLIKQYIIAGQTFRSQININADFIDKQTEEQDKKDKKANAKAAKERFELKKFQLEQELNLEKDTIKNNNENIALRFQAIQDASQKELELADLKRDYLLSQAGVTATGEKLILEKHAAEVLQIEENKQKGIEVILKSSFDKAKKRIEDENKLQDKAYNDQVTALQESLQLGEITVKQYEERLLKLKQEYSVKSIEAKIAQLEKELAAMLPFYDGYAELEQQLYNLRIALSDAETENYIDNVDKKAEAERKFEQFLRDQVTNASNVIARALNLDAGNINNLFSSLTDNIKVTTDEQGKLISKLEFDYTDALVTAGAATAVAGDISNAVFERNIANLDYQIEKNQEYYDTKIELATGDDELQRLLILESEQKRLELEAKKRKEQTKQFKFNKALAFNEAGIKTALAIVSALTTAPAPLGIALAAIVGALGTIQLIAIANSPIPKFKKGHLQGTHEGPAITNEERDEVWERDGVGSLIKGRNVPIMMKKGDKIHKSEKDYERYLRASILTSVDVNNQKLNSFQSTQILNINNEELIDKLILNTKAIERLKLNVSFNHSKQADLNHEFFKWQNNN